MNLLTVRNLIHIWILIRKIIFLQKDILKSERFYVFKCLYSKGKISLTNKTRYRHKFRARFMFDKYKAINLQFSLYLHILKLRKEC